MPGSYITMPPDTAKYMLVGPGTASRRFERDARVINRSITLTGDGMASPGTKELLVVLDATDARDMLSGVAAAVKAARAATQVKLQDGGGSDQAYFDVAAFKEWSIKSWPHAKGMSVLSLVFIPKTADWQTSTAEEVREW